MNIKKKIAVLFTAGMVALSASPFVLAATPEPAANQEQTQQTQTVQQTIAPAAGAYQTQQTQTTQSDTGYLTKGWAAFWIIFTFILNAVLSFWIGNRFYRLSKKDNHLSAELRALRKDVEEKFVKSVGGFAEAEIDITNNNESYAVDEEGIKPQEKQTVLRSVSTEEEERFRKWEEAQSRPKTPRRPKSAVKEELDEELGNVRKIKRKNYQPSRAETAEDEKEDMGETKEIKLKGEGVRSKAKEILGDIFPFKED